jgi:hypothetical protein
MIKYIQGDLFELLPYEEETYKTIPHVCNNLGLWGSGFVLAVSKKWPMELEERSPEWQYREWGKHAKEDSGIPSTNSFMLGNVQWVNTTPLENGMPSPSTVSVVNMIAQHETVRTNPKPIRYESLVSCMGKIRDHCVHRAKLEGKWHDSPAEIHCPKFGSDLAGGTWEFIEELIEEIWIGNNIPVTVYELGNKK